MIALRVGADEEGEANFMQQWQKPRPPQWGAFAARRQIRAFHRSGIAKTHSGNRDIPFVVELLAIELHPVTQAIAGRIVPRDAAFVHAPARRLARNQYARFGMNPNHGARFVRQDLDAHAARLDVLHQFVKRPRHLRCIGYAAARRQGRVAYALDKSSGAAEFCVPTGEQTCGGD